MKAKLTFILGLLTSAFCLSTHAQGTTFTYQGRLTENGAVVNGANDLTFTLYDGVNGGAPVGASNVVNDLAVTNGIFTVTLDFGAAFDGSARWLQIAVRSGASVGAYTNLIPRQPITATPYALRALNAGSANTAAGVTAGAVNNLALAADAVDGAKILNGSVSSADLNASLLNGTFWNLGGNAGTTLGAQFLGTSDNQPLEFKVNGLRALRLEPTAGAPNVIGGTAANQITAPTAGGGVLSGSGHRIFNASDYSVIAGGFSNRIQISSPGGFIGGGQLNWIVNSSTNSVIAGGAFNQVSRDHSFIGGGLGQTNRSDFAFIGGGKQNRIEVDSEFSTIGGGNTNTIATNSQYATIGGGRDNIASDSFATVPGGRGNIASGFGSTAMGYNCRASGAFSTALGSSAASADYSTAMGFGNTASAWYATAMGYLSEASGLTSIAMGSSTASGDTSTAMGASTASGQISTAMGSLTTASGFASTAMGSETTASGDYSTAMGRSANAIHAGSFVLADSQSADFASLRDNQFRVRADGGARFDFNAGEWVDLRYQSNILTSARIISTSSGGYLSLGGTWVNASDRERKTHFTPVDPLAVLAKVAAMPLSEWSYRTEGESVRHVGPMAQDFHAAFGLGGDDKGIGTVDADGVALAAIQGLNQKLEETRAENSTLKERVEKLEKLLQKF
ncbi:MAG: tail fiber domain-containing protein, partial [Verrucomicrobia subdivision 3 bacterium]|nr:tail fiber domain-containing protein [Limisphaerales bacterium]